MKVTIKAGVWKKRRKVWWVQCIVCGVRFHVHFRHWQLALDEAYKHVGGKKHERNFKKEK